MLPRLVMLKSLPPLKLFGSTTCVTFGRSDTLDNNEDGDDLDSSADSALSIGATSSRESDPGDEDIKVSALGNEMLADNNDDLNTDDIETGEFDSNEDMEPQCAPDDDHDDSEEAKLEVTAEVLFAENLLVSLVAKM
ncbi:hypothetical protein PF005_g28094 [Phytophthora fragariae]|uniref:Uncharacterized protein n=2 Tax=Phytophthora fragariae TaxID=53985 RepID=A0A6A3X6J7_9STRA|nr:hypothetical protein PF009_g11552 [Phytophthora fragariae]KAE9169121.1 hypothetical protein PF005_g28094 [Phytophthora fragariae]KAE9194182.1 hypothetical protein PF004_g20787 [Phytophthora fragariae]KAE9196150.1 hypothetical protein PF002_g23125 [Phytophthora fragariae]KAE9272883.1 hypothetical protein PF001_g27748 [Phytophthora fragariae]